MMRRPPKHVQGFIDRHGKPRFYLRRKGYPRLPLPGLPWSPEFMAAYHKSMAEKPVPSIGADHVVPRSIRALAIAYYDSAAFKALDADSTQGVYRNIIDRFCRGSVALTLGRPAMSHAQRVQLGAASAIAFSSGMSGK